jgi:hypothetical protein
VATEGNDTDGSAGQGAPNLVTAGKRKRNLPVLVISYLDQYFSDRDYV